MAVTLLEKVKSSLRIDDTFLDIDIQDNIDACEADMQLCGILPSKIVDTDPLILRAIKTYCKSEYSSDDKESEKYRRAYEMLRDHLSMSIDYTVEVVTP